MLRPLATTQTRKRFTASRLAALAGAGLIEVALVGAMLSGLGARIVREIPKALSIVDIAPPEPPKPEPVKLPEPEMVQPAEPTVTLPDIRIQRPAKHTITAVAVSKPVVSPPVTAASPAAAAPAAIPGTPLKSVLATHTTPPYPEISRRLGEAGSVQLHIDVDSNGDVRGVSVARSSGHARLDQAALDWVKSRWRYHAATRNGSGIPSETDAIVVFDLRNAN
jgi:protein TonB